MLQIAFTLITTEGRQVVLTGDAQASKVFWQVGSSAALGTYSTFKGTIKTDQSVTLITGPMQDDGVLTRIGAVTLDSDTVKELGGDMEWQ